MLTNIDQPKMSYEQCRRMLEVVEPLVRVGGKLYHIKAPDPISTAFTWDPELEDRVNDDEFEKIGVIPTFHSWGYYGFFKPSIEEVLRCLPAYLIGHIAAFEVEGPDDANDLSDQKGVLNAGYHMAMTTLYRKAGHVAL